MPLVVWGLLPKSAEDATKIEEEIDARIKDHNEDPDAHGLADMALYAHRTGDVLDHLEKSIKATHLRAAAQVADCVVAPTDGDYTSIQDALDAGKKNIYVKKGTYIISSTITILSSDVTIIGESRENTVLKLADNTEADIMRIGDGATAISGVVIKNLKFDGNKANQAPTGAPAALFLNGGSGYLIKDCLIEGNIIKDVKKVGLSFNYVQSVIVSDNYITGISADALLLKYSEYNLFTSNNISGNGNTAINIYHGYTKNNLFVGNQINNNYYGINGGGDYNSFIGNFVNENAWGFYLTYGSYLVISGNQFNSNTQSGLQISRGDNCIISNNESINNTKNGIYLSQGSGYPGYHIITGNRCKGNGEYGIKISSSYAEKFIITNNHLLGNTSGALYYEGTGHEIGHNITE